MGFQRSACNHQFDDWKQIELRNLEKCTPFGNSMIFQLTICMWGKKIGRAVMESNAKGMVHRVWNQHSPHDPAPIEAITCNSMSTKWSQGHQVSLTRTLWQPNLKLTLSLAVPSFVLLRIALLYSITGTSSGYFLVNLDFLRFWWICLEI